MADGTATINPAKVWFKTLGENMLDVVSFTVHDQMSALFEVQLTASASDGTVDLSQLVGSGAALRFQHHTGDRKALIRVNKLRARLCLWFLGQNLFDELKLVR